MPAHILCRKVSLANPARVVLASAWVWGVVMYKVVLIIALACLCGGCATVVRGTTDEVAFKSSPSGAEVHTSNGLACVTPCTLQIKKNEEFVATFKKAGYAAKDIPV